jgi:hypothetical protein
MAAGYLLLPSLDVMGPLLPATHAIAPLGCVKFVVLGFHVLVVLTQWHAQYMTCS